MIARWTLYALAFAFLASPRAEAADKPGSRSNAEGQSLAAELRSARPTENLEVTGLLRIREADGRRTWPFSSKKERKPSRSSALVRIAD